MYTEAKLMFLVCESPLHAGSGSDLDYIDNPIQRERHTGYPKIESSSLKGALRERFTDLAKLKKDQNLEAQIEAGFGPDHKNGGEHQGALGFSDARLLLMPVKSVKGIFAWVTCPAALQRLEQDMKMVDPEFKINQVPIEHEQALFFGVADKHPLTLDGKKIMLEEFVFEGANASEEGIFKATDKDLASWLATNLFPKKELEYWHEQLKNKLVILSDDDFRYFAEYTTEVITRNRIDTDTGTVAQGALFTEEYLPADSVMYALVMSHAEFVKGGNGKSAEEIMTDFSGTLQAVDQVNNRFQLGGNASIGKGLLRTVLIE
jgi:CRISPR-associated protein Cmr4